MTGKGQQDIIDEMEKAMQDTRDEWNDIRPNRSPTDTYKHIIDTIRPILQRKFKKAKAKGNA